MNFISMTYLTKAISFWFQPFETDKDVQIVIKNSKFNNIVFEKFGHFIFIESQMMNPVIFNNCNVTQTSGGIIQLAAANKLNLDLPLRARFEDMTAIGNDAYFSTLLTCLLYTSPSPRDKRQSRMPSSA